MTPERRRLPNRRSSTLFDFESMGMKFTASISRDAEGHVLELFLDNHKAGSSIGTLVRDAAIILSFALQHGADVEAIRRALCRDSQGRPLGPIGCALDLIANDLNEDHHQQRRRRSMSLIFDSFPDMQKAHAFREHVKQRFGLAGQVFATDDEAYDHDPFPFWVQEPPVVHIDRVWCESATEITAIKLRFGLSDEEVKARDPYSAEVWTMCNAESRVEDSVDGFGGVFVGT